MVKMKNRFLLFISLCWVSFCSYVAMAQTVGTEDLKIVEANHLKAFVCYTLDEQGLYRECNVEDVAMVKAPYRMYAYDKHGGVLYVVSAAGNFAVELTREQVRLMKRNKDVPYLRGSRLEGAIRVATIQAKNMMGQHNEMRKGELQKERQRDEAECFRREAEEQRREEARKVEEARKAKEREAARRQEYLHNHLWNVVPTNGASLPCLLGNCGKVTKADSVFMVNMDGKFIYYITEEPFQIGETINKVHLSTLPAMMSNSNLFKYHCEVFKDSIMRKAVSEDFVKRMNQLQYEVGVEKVKEKAPHGYFLNWKWDKNPNLTFRCNFFNLDSRTIKEMTLHWVLQNKDKKDLKSGVLKMKNVDIKPYLWRAAKWSYTSVEVPEEATGLLLQKVVIRYTNNEVATLTADDIFTNGEGEVLSGVPLNGEEYEYDETEMSGSRAASPTKSAPQPTKRTKTTSTTAPQSTAKTMNANDVFN